MRLRSLSVRQEARSLCSKLGLDVYLRALFHSTNQETGSAQLRSQKVSTQENVQPFEGQISRPQVHNIP